jgi:preprotein translocase subunit YajC
MPKPESPIRLGSHVHVTNHGKGKVTAFFGEENQVVEVELDKGGFVTAKKEQVKRVEAEE